MSGTEYTLRYYPTVREKDFVLLANTFVVDNIQKPDGFDTDWRLPYTAFDGYLGIAPSKTGEDAFLNQ